MLLCVFDDNLHTTGESHVPTTTTTTEYKTPRTIQFIGTHVLGFFKISLIGFKLEISTLKMAPPPAIAINAPEVGATYGTNYKSDPSFYAPVDFKKNGVDIAEATKYPPPNNSDPNYN